ncbi:TPA: hypothetical protein JI393_RS14365 [Acinetobacter baumannii]|uniref:hypothetical protein n=1 Tax=Acinetobacter indicus TaxID=756892 RepID=UPI000CEBDFE3|nr:hypothetical protein [Acinetobacter indicus]HBI1384562.1 hypothetical protein [Acinetobacter baumannii]HBI9064020.1 hypothetical protein [Acinetobacter baumannii]
MTGQEFLKKRGASKTAIFLSCLGSKETTHVHGENGTEYQRGPDGMALMLCCKKWMPSQTTNSQLETLPPMVSVASIQAALKKERMLHSTNRQFSLLGGSEGLKP